MGVSKTFEDYPLRKDSRNDKMPWFPKLAPWSLTWLSQMSILIQKKKFFSNKRMTWLKINKVIDGTLGTYKNTFRGKDSSNEFTQNERVYKLIGIPLVIPRNTNKVLSWSLKFIVKIRVIEIMNLRFSGKIDASLRTWWKFLGEIIISQTACIKGLDKSFLIEIIVKTSWRKDYRT